MFRQPSVFRPREGGWTLEEEPFLLSRENAFCMMTGDLEREMLRLFGFGERGSTSSIRREALGLVLDCADTSKPLLHSPQRRAHTELPSGDRAIASSEDWEVASSSRKVHHTTPYKAHCKCPGPRVAAPTSCCPARVGISSRPQLLTHRQSTERHNRANGTQRSKVTEREG